MAGGGVMNLHPIFLLHQQKRMHQFIAMGLVPSIRNWRNLVMKITGSIWSPRTGQRQRRASTPPSLPPKKMISFAVKPVRQSTSNWMCITSPMNRLVPEPPINFACFVINAIRRCTLGSNQISCMQPRQWLTTRSTYKDCSTCLQNIIMTFQHFEKSSKNFTKVVDIVKHIL